jgi:molybdate transport system substrate-binding protein
MQLKILSGGAAQGLVQALADRLKLETGYAIAGSFGAVGAMRDKLMAGEPADLLILTAAMIADLARQGRVDATSIQPVGSVATGVAVRTGTPLPAIDSAERLQAALSAAEALYFPDPERATAGIHFAKILERLCIAAWAKKARTHANGAAAMRALASSRERQAIGCTQVTEILNTAGVTLVGALPAPFELATLYMAGVSTTAAAPDQARALSALMTGAGSQRLRLQLGFQPIS